MVFIPRRFVGTDSDATSLIRTPVAIALAVVAAAGWAVAAFLAAQLIYVQPRHGETGQRAAPSEISQGCGALF